MKKIMIIFLLLLLSVSFVGCNIQIPLDRVRTHDQTSEAVSESPSVPLQTPYNEEEFMTEEPLSFISEFYLSTLDDDYYEDDHLQEMSRSIYEPIDTVPNQPHITVCAILTDCFERNGKRFITVDYVRRHRPARDGMFHLKYDNDSDKHYTLLVDDHALISIYLKPYIGEDEKYVTEHDHRYAFFREADWDQLAEQGTEAMNLSWEDVFKPQYYLLSFNEDGAVVCVWQDVGDYYND